MALKYFRLEHDSNTFNPEDKKDSIDSAHTDSDYDELLINTPQEKKVSDDKTTLEDEVRDMEKLPKWIGMNNHLKDWPDDTKSVKRYESNSEIAKKNAIRKAKQISEKAA